MKSNASGVMSVETITGYPISEGQLYQVFADAAGADQPERIGLRWLDDTYTEVATTWSLTTAAASASWHRIGVADTAPAGATRVRVIVEATAGAANRTCYAENVYLGRPIRTTGNLLDFNTESAEVDASGWVPDTNATVSRQAPAVSWGVNTYTAGGSVIAATAVAAGNCRIITAARPTVTPGTEYLAYAYLQPPTSGSTTWVELRFYDDTGTQLSATRSVLAAPGSTGYYRQWVSAPAPAGAVTCALAAGIDSATLGQVLRVETAVVGAASQTVAGTVIPTAEGNFEQGVAGWSTVAGAATVARSTPWGAAAISGAYALAITSATATTSTVRSPLFATPAAEGHNWRLQVYAKQSAGSFTSFTIQIHWYDAGGASLGVSGTGYAFPNSDWYLLTTDDVAPAGAVQAAVELVAVAAATNSVVFVDGVALWQVLPLTEVVTDDERGYARVTVRELPVGGRVSLYRVLPNGDRTLVRGPDGLIDRQAITSDLLVVEDHEAPLGVPVVYRLEIDNGSGVATRTTDEMLLVLGDVNETWLKDPGNPQRNMRVVVQEPPEWKRPVEQSAMVVRGRRNKVVLTGRRQGLEGDLSVWTRTDDERAALHYLLDSGNVLLWQAMPGMGVEDLYVNVGEVGEARTGGLAQEPWRSWTLPLTQADMPVTTGINGSGGRTWQDVVTEFATCADVLEAYETAEDLLLDRRAG
ncbi:carbohydrate binding domain-containing protein [Streptomyces sp. NPDC093065]|uniref:carbohydrate binding domain-containing protein n=1 Tax=Streptomyces sp. NPDC093065 TaxID=3366021 RepID=UPI0038278BD5